jgi:lysophospholipase L1-like esterase
VFALGVAVTRTAEVLERCPLPWSSAATFIAFGVLVGSGNTDRVRALGRHAMDVYKKVAVLLLNAVVCFACLELVSGAVETLKARALASRSAQDLDVRSGSSYYRSEPWAPRYWREFNGSRRERYVPFVLWRRAAFSGELINVDNNGVRSTPGANCGPSSYRVFVFGGSTVWGTGSPDWGTVPAYLQAALQTKRDRPICVVNFGESAYVSTQSLLQLLSQLQAGNIPDLVISYEGLNDAYSAYQSGKPGLHENLSQLVAAFEERKAVQENDVARLVRRTSLFSVTSALMQRVTHPVEDRPKRLTYQAMGVDEKVLARSVVKTYLANYDIVDGLARKFGFEFRFIWPPYITFGEKPLTAEERSLARDVDPALESLYQSVYRTLLAAAPNYPRLSDLAAIFDNHAELLWLDDVHVTPAGNQIIAEELVRLLGVPESERAELVREPVATRDDVTHSNARQRSRERMATRPDTYLPD